MSRLGLFLVIISAVSVFSAVIPPINRIVGGEDTTIYDYPHQVSIRNRPIFCPQCPYSHFCGGSIIAKNIVLTSAHCVDDRAAKTFAVVAGSNNRAGADGFIVMVKAIYMHEKYDIWSVDNDVALLHLAQDLPITYKSAPIELADVLPNSGELSTITGWGETVLNGDYSDKLRSVQVPILDKEDCQNAYKYENITNNMVCAGYKEGGRDMCKGDSGGPLIYKNKQIGIVSWGYECGSPSYPGVYTSVPAERDWIIKTINLINK
ncbi:hypothetical protein ACFFRR_009862 [Megaselia abdita]